MRRFVLFLLSLFILFTVSCEIGLGSAVDIAIPTINISYPPKNAVIRDSFIVSGTCSDDSGVIAVSVQLTNPETNKIYGPFDAELSEDAKSWSILLNKSDISKTTNEFDSHEQWDFPDGNYIVSAVAYDGAKKISQIASSPLSIDNTPPVLIVSKPLAIGNETAVIYGRSLKLAGDIAEEHETSKLVFYYRQFDNSTDEFIDSQVHTLEITDTAELNAMSSSNPLILAKYDENKKNSVTHQRYLTLYGENDNYIDKYYYCAFMLEDNAKVYQNPDDNGSGNGNQTKHYYLLSSDYKNILSADYSLTAPRLMKILRGDSDDYKEDQIKTISEILLRSGNYASSCGILESENAVEVQQIKNESSKISLNPHNNPIWNLDEYGVSETNTAADIKSYSAGSSLLLSIKAGRDLSYPDPKTVKADLYDLGEFNSSVDYYSVSIADINPINIIDPAGASKWDEAADDSEKTYTFALDTQTYELMSKHVYRIIVNGTDRNKTDLEPENDNQYMFILSTSNNSPKISILEPAEDLIFGKEVNDSGITIKGYAVTDSISLKSIAEGGIKVSAITLTNLADNSSRQIDLSLYDCEIVSLNEESHNKYAFEILIKAKNGNSFVPEDESKYYYTVVVQAQDNSDNAPGEKNVKFYVDNKKPELKIISVTPDDGSGFVNGKIKISGVASDGGNLGSDLKSLSYVIKNEATETIIEDFNNVEIALNESWSFDLSTKLLTDNSSHSNSGTFQVIVTAQDKVGNVASVQKTLYVDQTKDQPVLDFSNADKNVSSVEALGKNTNMLPSVSGNKLYGSVKDDDGLASVIMTCRKVTSTQTEEFITLEPVKALVPGSKLYDFEYVLPSVQGQYEINVKAQDIYAYASLENIEKKETSFDNLTHTLFVTIDDGAPVFSSMSPVQNDSAWYMGSKQGNPKQLIISGTVSDGNGFSTQDGFVEKHTVKIGNEYKTPETQDTTPVSNLSITAQSATTKVFTDTITLPSKSGSYKTIYTAKDIYNQETEYDFAYSVDVDDPVIEGAVKIGNTNVTSDIEKIDGYITDNNILVEVNVFDGESGIKNVTYIFDEASNQDAVFSPMTHSVSGGTNGNEKWTANITFPDGKNIALCIRVTDNAGNYIERIIKADVDKTNPVLDVKWYQVKGETAGDNGSILVPSETAYVNQKDLYLYGNYTDGEDCSGVEELIFKIAGNEISPSITYYSKAFTTSNTIDDIINATFTDPQTNITENPYKINNPQNETEAKRIKAFVAVISHEIFTDENFESGKLTISAQDKAGNKINGGSLNVMTLKKDNVVPKVSGINITKSFKTQDSLYYLRNISDGKLTVSGTTTDNFGVDKTVLTVTGTIQGQIKEIYKNESNSTGWSFNDVDLSKCQKVADQTTNKDAVIKITAFDKAGNIYNVADINVLFDEDKPAVLTGGEDGSDPDDTSNPFSDKYTLRGKTVYKYAGIKVGAGTYSDASYGRESSVPLTVTFIGEKDGSGIAKIEYKMLAVSKVTDAYKDVTTGKYIDIETIPADEACSKTGNFALSQSTYTHYGDTTQIPCTLGTATINGFESTVDGTPNLVFIRATDNCGNESDWFVLLIQVDNSTPQIIPDVETPTSLLTNGKSTLPTLSGTFEDDGSGLKAARVYVDGKIVMDGCLKGLSGDIDAETYLLPDSKGDENKDLTITAKDSDGQAISPLKNGAVSVTFTNKYGTFTYDAYRTKEIGASKESFSNAASYAKWTLTLTPQEGTWFEAITKSVPQIAIEAEDWAEDASGSGNKSNVAVTTLDIDKEPPVASITAPETTANSSLNGKHSIKGTVSENHTPESVSIYYSTNELAEDGSLPAELKSLDGWILLKSISTESDTDNETHTYNATVQEIYNFEVKNVDFNSFIGTEKSSGIVHLLVCAQDKAGNINYSNNNVTINSDENGTSAYRTISVDKDSDRPIVTVTSIDLFTEEKNDEEIQRVPLSANNYLPLDTDSINFKVSDDDGVSAVEYRITKAGATAEENSVGEWISVSDVSAISTNGASIKFKGEGKQFVEFRITDNENTNKPFTSIAENSLNQIYLTDTAENSIKYGSTAEGYTVPVVYVNVDTSNPFLSIKGVQFLSDNTDEAIADAGDVWKESGYSNETLGGPARKYLRVKVSASDDGSGVKTVTINALLDNEKVTENAVQGILAKDDSDNQLYDDEGKPLYYLIIPSYVERDSASRKDNSTYVATITVTDNAGKQTTDTINFKVDDKSPEITIKSPASTENLSGATAIDGTISESVKLWYAISPIEESPDNYDNQTAFNFVKPDKAETPTLPTKDKANKNINPKDDLWELCKYKEYSSSAMSFYLWLDGKLNASSGKHEELLNQWLKDIGITTSDDLSSITNPFDDIVQLYFHVKAQDTAGNINELHYPIRIDPQGSRPTINIGYPSLEQAGLNTAGLTLGGSPTIIGTASGTNIVDYVWLQIDCDEDGDWDSDDFDVLVDQKDEAGNSVYELGNMKTKTLVTEIADGDSAELYAIRVKVSSQSWSQKININGELNPPKNTQQNTGVPNTKTVRLWAYATDHKGFSSGVEERKIIIDGDVPVIDQNILLVQWAEDYDGSNGFDIDEDGNIKLVDNATTASRSYNEKENIHGQWYLIGKVTDDSGIKSIDYKVNGGANVSAITKTGDTYPESLPEGAVPQAGVYIRSVPSKTENASDYLFCLPIGNKAQNTVGEYSIEFTAYENEDSNPRYATKTFTVLYDNLAPVITTETVAETIENNNGVFTFTGVVTEDDVGTIKQTGVERIAFYFTRDIAGQKTVVFDPMIRTGITENTVDYSTLKDDAGAYDDGLYWQKAVIDGVTGTEITVADTTNLTNVHAGGLAKINGVIYRIEAVHPTDHKVSLSGAPGTATSILFAIANVVDNTTAEGEGQTAIRNDYDGYGWGYYSDGSYDDGDLMIESLIQENTKYTWEASINSKNISDGPVTLNYVVFDKAGNVTTVKQIERVVKNNAPRLAGVKLGTDENGNGKVDEGELITTYSNEITHQYNKGFDEDGNKIHKLTIPFNSTDATPKTALKVKGATLIQPEIVGGNGDISYTYKVAKRIVDAQGIDTQEGWDTEYFDSSAIPLGTGTADDDDSYITFTTDESNSRGGILFTVKDFLKNGIDDGKHQKFSFTLSDSTPGSDAEDDSATIASQTASFDVIMDIDLNDKTAAQNKIIPFYWKSKDVNSLKDNDSNLGHIELSADLANTTLTRTPKVSGAVKLEGIAQDNSLLKELYVTIPGYNNNNPIAIYESGTWIPLNNTITIDNATYGEYKLAGYIDAIPQGKDENAPMPMLSQEYGHVVHWTMVIDTEAMLSPATGITIKVSALDKGTPSLNEQEEVEYASNEFDYNGTGTVTTVEGQVVINEPETPGQTGGNDGTGAYTYNYEIDVVPYIRGIKTALSTKSKKSDSSEYDRTALGHYPVSKDETIYLYGFNLAGGTLYDSAGNSAGLGDAIAETDDEPSEVFTKYESYKGFTLYKVSGISSFTSGQVYVTVGIVDSLNNKNSNVSYNLKPNGQNNDILTDDVVLDVWNINSEAGKPSSGGRIDELTMKINPASSANDIVGFAFLNGPKDYSRPNGSNNSYATGMQSFGNQHDSHSTAAFAYDTRGNVFSLDSGGNEGDPLHFEIITSSGTSTHIYLDYVNQLHKRDGTGDYLDLRYKARSPNIVTSPVTYPNGTNDTNIYMVYYDSYNDEIRYEYGLMSNIAGKNYGGDLFHSRRENNNGQNWRIPDGQTASNQNPYSCRYSQVIATDPNTNLPAGDQYKYTGTPLGGAGEFVDIDVIPKGSTGGKTDEDVVVVVWYDAKAKALKYAYNPNPDDYSWRTTNTGINEDYRGLNSTNWTGVQTIFTDAGEYCSVKVDGNGGIHISAYDSKSGDLRYAYLSSYDASSYNESTQSFIVDSAGNVGSHMRMDVALASDGTTPVPYISYYGSNMPKLAYPVAVNTTNGAVGDMFTGNWEVTYIPTTSEIDDLDYKRLMNVDSRINVGVWKYIDTVTTGENQHVKGQIKNSKTGSSNSENANGKFYGNGTANPLVSYSVLKDTANSRIETAQMQ